MLIWCWSPLNSFCYANNERNFTDIYLFISFRTPSNTHGLCWECFRVGSCHIKYVWCGPAVSELDDIPRKPLRWPHKRCDRRCLPNSWQIELTLQNNPILASAVVYSPRLILPISCLCTELLLPHWNRFNIITFHTTYWHWLPYSQCCQLVQINSVFFYLLLFKFFSLKLFF